MKQIDLGAVTAYAIAVENGFQGTKQEWLDSLKGGVDVASAQVGQIIKVKSVDDAGKPTEWEAVDPVCGDYPTGGDTLSWDGNTEGLTAVGNHYKVSDIILTAEDLASGGSVTKADVVGSYESSFTAGSLSTGEGYISVWGDVLIITVSGIFYAGNTYAETGIYFAASETTRVKSFMVTGYTGFPYVDKIEDKYLPDWVSEATAQAEQAMHAAITASEGAAVLTYLEAYNQILKGEAAMDYLVHMSDKVPTMADLEAGYAMTMYMPNETDVPSGAVGMTMEVLPKAYSEEAFNSMTMEQDGIIMCGADFGVYIVPTDGVTLGDVTFPKKGVWTIPGIAAFRINGYSFSGGANSWNELEDKPFSETTIGSSDTLEWDGDITGLETIEGTLYKVSEAVPTAEDLANGYSVWIVLEGQPRYSAITAEQVAQGEDYFKVDEDGSIWLDICIKIVPDSGTYFYYADSNNYVKSLIIPGYTGFPGGTVITPIDSKFLPESLQFGKSTEWGEVLPEVTLTYSADDDAYLIADTVLLVPGNEYTVNWNDTAYQCVAKAGKIMDLPCVFLGNTYGFDGNDTGEPFVIMVWEDGEAIQGLMGMASPMDGSTDPVTISIMGDVTTVTKVDEDLYDRWTAFWLGEDDYIYSDSSVTKKTTIDELRAAAKKGPVVFRPPYAPGIYYNPLHLDFIQGLYGFAVIPSYNSTSGAITGVRAYTAEYTTTEVTA